MSERGIRISVLLLLALSGLYAFAQVYAFSQGRFFTIDEYEYGHATWLVAQGRTPYVDFFEHHFPLSYVIHAPLYWIDWSFPTAALLLRKIVFVYLLALSVLSGVCCYALTRNPYASLLSSFLPATFGFSLMSAIDYRGDNFAAYYLGACLLLLEWNRRRKSVALAGVCGVLAALAACTTQKLAVLAGGTLTAMLLIDLGSHGLRTLRGVASSSSRPFVAHPIAFVSAGALVGLVLLAIAAALGMLPAGFEATILHAIEHEKHYERFSIFEKGFVGPFWRATWWSTLPILVFAAGALASRDGRFWIVPIAASIVGGAMMAAPYPYSFVFLCFVTVLVSVRGFCGALAWIQARLGRRSRFVPVLHFVALVALANQLGFVSDRTSNAHQLAVLAKLETFGDRSEIVIDNAGGAMFSGHGSYYFYHGDAHREMFRDYFEKQLIEDYRDSRALFWIRDRRSDKLPEATRDYLESHYVHAGGDLHGLGFSAPPTREAPRTRTIDVVREGDYFVLRGPPKLVGRAENPDLRIDGEPVVGHKIHLEERQYELTQLPQSSGYVISLLPAEFFMSPRTALRYSMNFEYK